MSELSVLQLARAVRIKAEELAARVEVFYELGEEYHKSHLAMLLLEGSAEAVAFWVDELKKAVTK